ncbi:terminase small subunit [Romboutsia lituseburensis]|uniref:Phage terminase small subunit n=1 Tax=Romboutsia lituseburensis DSM 797 TaxID=1121325 RepID=A0A1G9U0A2_9FIRM|nr:terminase small subunit [Romboutsia lituseburensis]CEH34729.1 PBSX phage terminase small subunit [Romboutsia lituseburensis]SDM53366.1 phage terminase small subunit [Romboutsia lituseburensis DSM 797]
MARARSPSRDKAKEIYLKFNGDIKLIDIAKDLNINDSQVRKWKSQDKWDDELKGALPITKSNVTNKNNKKVEIKKSIEREVKEVLENTELTDKQRLFCIYYIKCFNATKAYQKAYGCDYITANSHGYKMLSNVVVKQEIDKLKQEKLNRVMLSEDDIFQRYIDIAFADITDYITFGQEEVPVMGPFGPLEVEGETVTKIINVVKFKESTEVDGTIISEVKQGKDGASIKLQDKMKALQWLSDRVDLLPTYTRLKLENEKTKLELDVMKLELDIMKQGGQDEEVEDDGFMEALETQVGDAWDD